MSFSNSNLYERKSIIPPSSKLDPNANVYEYDEKKPLFSPYFFQNAFRTILQDRDCKKLFFFILLLSITTTTQFIVGLGVSCLAILSHAFHSCFDLLSMSISLFAMILAKHNPTKKYSYGYDRFEVLSGFTNGIFLLFVSLFLSFESFERLLLEPIELQGAHHQVIGVSILSFVVNLVGVVFFREYAHVRSEVEFAHQDNLNTILAHIVIDFISSLAVILSTWLMQMGWLASDPIVAIGIVALMVYTALPICKRTGKVLLQTTPASLYNHVEKALREASTLEGVLECCNEHFWTQSPGVFVGSFTIRVRSDADEQDVLARVRPIFSQIIQHLTIQVEKNSWDPLETENISHSESDIHSEASAHSHSHDHSHSHSHAHSHSH